MRPTILPTNGPSATALPDIGALDQTANSMQGPSPSVQGTAPGLDKGKGKEKDAMMVDGQAGMGVPLTGGPGVASGTDDAGEKKRKNTYKHLIKGIPGTFFPYWQDAVFKVNFWVRETFYEEG